MKGIHTTKIKTSTFLLLTPGIVWCSGVAVTTNRVNAEGAEVTFSLEIPNTPVLEINLLDGDEVAMKLRPNMATAAFGVASARVQAGTSNITGFTLVMNPSNPDLISGTDLVKTLDPGKEYYCTAELNATNSNNCTFEVNRWGYRLGTDAADTYKALQNGIEITSSDAPTNGEPVTINFASRIDAYQPSGTYMTTLNFVAVANPVQYIQNLNTEECTTTPLKVYDSRDYEEYTVQRLADNNCWMLDNLRLNPNSAKITTKDTNVSGAGVLTGYSYLNHDSSASSRYTTALYNDDSRNTAPSNFIGGNGSGKVGTYYNYCAASAGTYCYAGGAGSGDAAYDLCPAGWRLPVGGTSSEYVVLRNSYSSDDDFLRALSLPYSGHFDGNGVVAGINEIGYFWTSTFRHANYMYALVATPSSLTLNSTNVSRPGLFSVRCLLKSE